jgi:hypothetical protein
MAILSVNLIGHLLCDYFAHAGKTTLLLSLQTPPMSWLPQGQGKEFCPLRHQPPISLPDFTAPRATPASQFSYAQQKRQPIIHLSLEMSKGFWAVISLTLYLPFC